MKCCDRNRWFWIRSLAQNRHETTERPKVTNADVGTSTPAKCPYDTRYLPTVNLTPLTEESESQSGTDLKRRCLMHEVYQLAANCELLEQQ